MQTPWTPDADSTDALPLPRHPELIRLSLRLAQLQSSGELTDAVLVARSLDYVAGLVAELDRVRPVWRRRKAAA
jgi:hypothetical protein